MLRFFRSLTARMMIGSVLVSTLTSVVAVMVMLLLYVHSIANLTATDYKSVAQIAVLQWLFGHPDGQPNTEDYSDGLSLVVSPDGVVAYSQGDTVCRAGTALADCAPELVGLAPGERFYQVEDERWAEVVFPVVTGQTVIIRRGPPPVQLFLLLGSTVISGVGNFMLVVCGVMFLISVPVGLLLSWIATRPLARRMRALALASRKFAEGELSWRANDKKQDEIGLLGRQFDDMAGALEQNIALLRDMAHRNAELAQRAEEAAIRAERVRLSRDLHDAIAQRLFSLSVSTAALPDQISKDQAKGAEQARVLASMAEQTLLDLRALLLELRPSTVIERGLSDALHTMCAEWQATNNIPVNISMMLAGRHMPAAIEDVLYRITQEALNNICKHANATNVDVSLVQGRTQITLSVTDNGTGFDTDQQMGHGKFGLMSMRERAQSVGGTFSIESDRQNDVMSGTTIRVTLPINTGETIGENIGEGMTV
jgi:signal transduction histidine kinase